MQPIELFQRISPSFCLSERNSLTQTIECYAKSPFSSPSHLLYRILNAVKHALSYLGLGVSDWQKTSKLLQAKLRVLPCTSFQAEQLLSQAEGILKLLVQSGRLPQQAPVSLASATKTVNSQTQQSTTVSKANACVGAQFSMPNKKSIAPKLLACAPAKEKTVQRITLQTLTKVLQTRIASYLELNDLISIGLVDRKKILPSLIDFLAIHRNSLWGKIHEIARPDQSSTLLKYAKLQKEVKNDLDCVHAHIWRNPCTEFRCWIK